MAVPSIVVPAFASIGLGIFDLAGAVDNLRAVKLAVSVDHFKRPNAHAVARDIVVTHDVGLTGTILIADKTVPSAPGIAVAFTVVDIGTITVIDVRTIAYASPAKPVVAFFASANGRVAGVARTVLNLAAVLH